MQTTTEFAREAFEVVGQLEQLTAIEQVLDAIERAARRHGSEHILLTGLVARADQDFREVVLASRWPAGFLELYAERRFSEVDPVARDAIRSTNPFLWTCAEYAAERDARAREVIERAADFNIVQGLVVPIHGPGGYEAVVSYEGAKFEVPKHDLPALHLMSLYAFDRVRRLLGVPSRAPTQLTPRERDVLAWAAQGKSAWEIGALLGISNRTVEQHLSMAMRKLGATNRTHAVVIALRERIID